MQAIGVYREDRCFPRAGEVLTKVGRTRFRMTLYTIIWTVDQS